MKKLLSISGIVFVLLFIQLSGCIDTSNNDDGFWDFILPFVSSPEVDELLTDPKIVTMSFMYDGNMCNVDYIVYKGLNDYLASLTRNITYYDDPPTTKDFIIRDLDQNHQKIVLMSLVNYIANFTEDKDDQARIAVSMVQNIPYDDIGLESGLLNSKYPYEIVYSQTGVCGGKSVLLTFLLRELGFSVVIFEYEQDSHRAVGIKCPYEYSYNGTGYCFVETTAPSIITDSDKEYEGVGKLSSYELIFICDGLSFDSVSEEYNDSIEYHRLLDLADLNGGTLSPSNYDKWMNIANKYGLL
ncbi:MAG: hypothetical protein LN408_03750 [Candidatus Thermoplasmatota archaeon]|nr:hypothetical protein [Candidatus Thermoplasmatota archaeon]